MDDTDPVTLTNCSSTPWTPSCCLRSRGSGMIPGRGSGSSANCVRWHGRRGARTADGDRLTLQGQRGVPESSAGIKQ